VGIDEAPAWVGTGDGTRGSLPERLISERAEAEQGPAADEFDARPAGAGC
jgi:hypothetical protein